MVKQVLQFEYGSCSGIVSRRGLIIEAHCRNQLNKTKLVLYISCYFYFKSCLKQLHVSNKMKWFSYKGGCGIHILDI